MTSIPLCPSWSISLRYYCLKLPLRFSVFKLGSANHFIPFVFEFLLRPSYDPSWKLLPQLVSIVQSFLKASSSNSRVQIRPLRSLSFICFRNFSQHAHASHLKPPLAPSPACFNHLITFESLLLQLSRANLPCSGPLIFEIPLIATIHA